MAMATMNRISISLIFLIMISMVLPTSAIMFASGSTDNSDSSSDTGSSEDNSDSSSDTGSSEDNSDSPPTDFLPPNVDSTSSEGLQMIMVIHQQRLQRIIPLYRVNLLWVTILLMCKGRIWSTSS